ncbi:MAG TPA: hypothetical protein PKY82_31315 [Pyrinomonadaceae bacterium]|nr:hypothetical protein [Pyrinomonadaceae bacterium]
MMNQLPFLLVLIEREFGGLGEKSGKKKSGEIKHPSARNKASLCR